MADPLATISTRRTPQSERADSRQERNSAGGYTFVIDDVARLRRFLTLGTTGGTYYSGEQELTRDNADVVIRLAGTDPVTLVDEVVAVSTAGRAPKTQPALFALAVAASLADDAGRAYALAALPKVARTGTHLFTFAGYVEQFRGWGRGLRRAVAEWYTDKPVGALALQSVKYRQRAGWTHRDLLRLAHPETSDEARRALFSWILRGELAGIPSLVEAYTQAQDPSNTATSWAALIEANPDLPWEAFPDAALTEPKVWEALIRQDLPQTALMRQLPRLTRLGLLAPMGELTGRVAAQIADPQRLRGARVHPVNVLIALRTYESGRSARGESSWEPSRPIVDALDAAFYAAYGAVEPTGKRTLLALDVSGSMGWSATGTPLTAREASAALALVTANVEPSYDIVGFTSRDDLSRLAVSPRQRISDAIRAVSDLPFGGTDCALPMVWALRNKVEVDVFHVYTDNETWAGRIHPHQALAEYRQKMGIDARVAVVAMTPTRFSIADPTDAGMLDVAGFDSAVPSLLGDFGRGAF